MSFAYSDMEKALRRELTAKGLEMPTYAVVVPVVGSGDDAALLIEVRAAGISQAGDPCFPGGRIEPGETPAQAASRELEEELGIRVPAERFLGQLPTVHTPLGSRTDVFVCLVPPEEEAKLRLSPGEVSTVLRAPVSYFLSDPHAGSYPFGGHDIWGMTAGAVRHFCAAWKRAFSSSE